MANYCYFNSSAYNSSGDVTKYVTLGDVLNVSGAVKSYVELNKKYYYCECVIGNRYEPTIKNRLTGEVIPIAEHARVCVPSGEVQIYAKPLDTYVKVFTAWDKEKYMMGKPGDYIAVRTDDMHDVYAIDKDIFAITYEEC